MNSFFEKLKTIRIEKGVSQLTVANHLGITRSSYSHYENGLREPSLDILKKICLFFEVSSDYLIGVSDSY